MRDRGDDGDGERGRLSNLTASSGEGMAEGGAAEAAECVVGGGSVAKTAVFDAIDADLDG